MVIDEPAVGGEGACCIGPWLVAQADGGTDNCSVSSRGTWEIAVEQGCKNWSCVINVTS